MSHDFQPTPTSEHDRIASLDLLRGFALLGILLMNIQVFAMPGPAYTNPTTFGDLSGINLWAWAISHVLADQKFISLFSILFGAGICLFSDRAERRSGGSMGVQYRRMAWLLVFGLIHAHLIWYGDILVSYALCGCLVYGFRGRSPRALLIWSAVFLLLPALYNGLMQMLMPDMPASAKASLLKSWSPSAERIQSEVSAYIGRWTEQQAQRHRSAVLLETLVFPLYFFWRGMSMMLLGMALYKLQVLNASRAPDVYRRLILIGGALGLSLSSFGVYFNFQHQWSLEYSMFGGALFNYFGSVGIALAYLGLIMRLHQSQSLPALRARLAAVGRMAFSNYIAQSLICTFVFYGFGLGLFGGVPRWQQLGIVLAVWAALLGWSPWWLKRFRFGPLEWLWRGLSYSRWSPLLRTEK